jgi:diguanylate cyclase (GGDEF)-like protein
MAEHRADRRSVTAPAWAAPEAAEDAPRLPEAHHEWPTWQPGAGWRALWRRAKLRFEPELEARYLKDTEVERLRLMRNRTHWIMALSASLLLADWFMVPDQFWLGVCLRLFIHLPLLFWWLSSLTPANVQQRERYVPPLSLVAAGINMVLCVQSHDVLAAPYLIGLAPIILFNGGLLRLRFGLALRTNLLILALFALTLCALPDPPMPVMWSMSLALLATTMFTLWAGHGLELEDRRNWLMRHREHELQATLEAANRRLSELSRFDGLTGLANRRYFNEFLGQVWTRAEHDGETLSVLMMDIDFFKRYNDHYGHVQGDACLKAVADVLKDLLRKPEDLVARLGGEEFVAVLSHASREEAAAVAHRIAEGLARLRWPHAKSDVSAHLTLSIGVASVRADATLAGAQALIDAADEALYRAKTQGRNRVVVREPGQPLMGPKARPSSAPVPVSTSSEQDDLDIAQARLQRPWHPWPFPARLERQYQAAGAATRLRYFLITGVLSLLVFNIFLPVDYLLANDVWPQALFVRLALFTPLAAAVIVAVTLLRRQVLRYTSAWLHEAVVMASGVGAAGTLFYILSISHSPLIQYYHVGLMVVVMYGNMVQRLRFGWAVVFSALVYAMHLVGVLTVQAREPRLLAPMATLVGATAVFTLLANFAQDRHERQSFVLGLRRKHLLQDLASVNEALQRLSRVDALTGLFNRRHMDEALAQLCRRAAHDEGALAIVMIDVDHFKAYNDHYGHPAGDQCLSKVAKALADSLRQSTDVIGRYGGEEFIAVLPQADEEAARRAAQRLVHAVAALGLPHVASASADHVTVSIGVAHGRVSEQASPMALIEQADAALYRAKAQGRNQVCVQCWA